MPFLTIGPLTLDVSEARKPPAELIGAVERAHAGNFLGEVHAVKDAFRFVAAPMAEADFLALDALHMTLQSCGGDALFGVTRTCLVEIGEAEYAEDHANDRALLFVVSVVLRED